MIRLFSLTNLILYILKSSKGTGLYYYQAERTGRSAGLCLEEKAWAANRNRHNPLEY